MQTLTVQNPAQAQAFFEAKMAFTTGPMELDRMIQSGDRMTIIDVRDSEDYAKGHIPGAINLPKSQWSNTNSLSRDKTNVIYCYTTVCHLAAAACAEFAKQGFPVMELDGGFEEWKENDLEIERMQVNRLFKHKDRLLHRRD